MPDSSTVQLILAELELTSEMLTVKMFGGVPSPFMATDVLPVQVVGLVPLALSDTCTAQSAAATAELEVPT